MIKLSKQKIFGLLLILLVSAVNLNAQKKKQFTFEDAMKFRDLRTVVMSDNGNWVAYTSNPDRGDGDVFIHSLKDTVKYSIPRGSRAVFTDNESYVASIVLPKQIESENAKTPKDKPKNGMTLLRLKDGNKVDFDNIAKFEFSNDSKWLAFLKNKNEDQKSEKMKKKILGSELNLRHISSGTDIKIDFVTEFVLDSSSKYLFYAISSLDGKRDGIYARELTQEFAPELLIKSTENEYYSNICWSNSQAQLAYIVSNLTKEGKPNNGSLFLWDPNQPAKTQFAMSSSATPKDWYIHYKNDLKWTSDGKKLYFGLKPISEKDTLDKEKIKFSDSTFYNSDSILSKRDIVVWHWNDQRIGTNQVVWWKENKDRTFATIYDRVTKKTFQLADLNLTNVVKHDNSNFTMGYDDLPYSKETTWDGWYFDLYSINLETGTKIKIATRLQEEAQISPTGRYIIYYKDKHWYLYDNKNDLNMNLTEKVNVNFWNEENDVPGKPGSYGFALWLMKDNNETGFYVYDKFDVWFYSLKEVGTYLNMTSAYGRINNIRYRHTPIYKDKKYYNERDTVYLSGLNRTDKYMFPMMLETHILGGLNINKEPGKNKVLVAKAKNAQKFIMRKESFEEFPDLYYTEAGFAKETRITDVNPNIKDYLWGKVEIVRWVNSKGDSLDGYIMKPEGFDSKKKYPTLVYIYEQFSDGANSFYQPRNNHRPIYQTYLGDGYLVFVPDIKYYDGYPGWSATDAVTTGVNYLINKGYVDKDRIALQGHSWGAYQGAFIATQTDMFKAIAVGAPVGNMLSAYSQIRTGTGLARQFQYETQQSRIGGHIWDSLSNYLANSPVVQANKSNTPLLILHGTIDEAVPFAQGVELYLAFRRLQKPCWLIEYKTEPHHPKKYENRLDWSIKMKEFFDHYLLKKPAPKWLESGEPFMGE